MEKLFLPVVLGTAREGRRSERVARFLAEYLDAHSEIETTLVDIREHSYTKTTPPWGIGGADEDPTKWKEVAERADGFVLVVPEYNRGYPGELKMFLDSLHNAYNKKPVVVCGVSTGMFGGRALIEHLRPVLLELKMVPMRGGIYVGKIKEAFDDEGKPTDSEFTKRVDKQLSELMWFARALKNAQA